MPDDENEKDRDDKDEGDDESDEKSDEASKSDAPAEPEESEESEESDDEDSDGEKADAKGEEDEEDEDDDEDDESLDASPEAIAKRVAALGPDDNLDAIADEEEKKLAARKRKRRGKAKRGLELAASKRLKKIAAKAPKAKRTVAAAVEEADPLLERTQAIGDWAKKNQKLVGGVAAAAIAVFAGFGVMTYLDQKKAAEASVTLAAAVADQRGRIGEAKDDDDDDKPKDPTPIFKTAEERRTSALAKYRDVSGKFKGTGAATLARLAEGSLLLDARDANGAAAAFSDVKASPLAQADSEVRGRALEGLGFSYELQAQLDASQADKHLEDAQKTFRELENTDIEGFKELGMYHQARVAQARGDKQKALELLKSLHERLAQPGGTKWVYLQEVTDERLRALDPMALPPKPAGMLGGPGGNKLTEAQLRQLFEQLQKHGGGGGDHQE